VAKARYQNRIDLLQGTLDFMILQTLRWGAQHGYGISHAINANSADAFKVGTGSMYPALHRFGKTQMDSLGMANVGEQPARQVLHPDPSRQETTDRRAITLASTGRRDDIAREASTAGGLNAVAYLAETS
jgi:hypothetical protein